MVIMGYRTYDKLRKTTIEYFDAYWKAEGYIKHVYGLPEGYTFKTDVYDIIDEDGNHAEKPEEEKKPYSITQMMDEKPEEFFYRDRINGAPIEETQRIAYFDTLEEAEAALEKYKSQWCRHKSRIEGDQITYNQYYIEELKGETPVKLAEWDEKEYDYRGEGYQDYDLYIKSQTFR